MKARSFSSSYSSAARRLRRFYHLLRRFFLRFPRLPCHSNPVYTEKCPPSSMTSAPQEIVSAHSPDSDDAFMFYGLATRKVRSSLVSFRHVLEDIESLNRKAMEGCYELSAISYHAYPYVADKYVLMASGSSIGDGYGPMIIATRPMEPEELKGKR